MKYLALVALLSVSAVAFPIDDQSDFDATEVPEGIDFETTVPPGPQNFEDNSDEEIVNEDRFVPTAATPLPFPQSGKNVNVNKDFYVQTVAPAVKEDRNNDVIINKQFFVHSAPQEFDAEDFLPTSPRPSIRVYFIALPASAVNNINNLKEEKEENKVVFVVKKKKPLEEYITERSTNDDWKNEISSEESEARSGDLRNQR